MQDKGGWSDFFRQSGRFTGEAAWERRCDVCVVRVSPNWTGEGEGKLAGGSCRRVDGSINKGNWGGEAVVVLVRRAGRPAVSDRSSAAGGRTEEEEERAMKRCNSRTESYDEGEGRKGAGAVEFEDWPQARAFPVVPVVPVVPVLCSRSPFPSPADLPSHLPPPMPCPSDASLQECASPGISLCTSIPVDRSVVVTLGFIVSSRKRRIAFPAHIAAKRTRPHQSSASSRFTLTPKSHQTFPPSSACCCPEPTPTQAHPTPRLVSWHCAVPEHERPLPNQARCGWHLDVVDA